MDLNDLHISFLERDGTGSIGSNSSGSPQPPSYVEQQQQQHIDSREYIIYVLIII